MPANTLGAGNARTIQAFPQQLVVQVRVFASLPAEHPESEEKRCCRTRHITDRQVIGSASPEIVAASEAAVGRPYNASNNQGTDAFDCNCGIKGAGERERALAIPFISDRLVGFCVREHLIVCGGAA